MAKKILALLLALTTAPLLLTGTVASAEPHNPSVRSLNKMSRRGEPTVFMRALAAVCPTVKKVTGNEFLWKSKTSKH